MMLDCSWNFLHTRLDVIYASHYYLKVWTPICLKLHLEFRSSNDWNSFVRYCIHTTTLNTKNFTGNDSVTHVFVHPKNTWAVRVQN